MSESRPHDALSNARTALTSVPAPSTALPILSTLAGEQPRVTLRYVADRLVLTPESFLNYLRMRARDANEILPEALAVSIAEDVANELVPKWLQVSVHAAGPLAHTVTVEDRQPGWDHPTLLRNL
jgi:hypothetical protein